jgi:hypothetical protein
MTDKEAMKLALEALELVKWTNNLQVNEAITALKERLLEASMREVQRLGQEIEQEPLIGCVNHDCAKCKEKNT